MRYFSMRKKTFFSLFFLTCSVAVLLVVAASIALSRMNAWVLRTIEGALQRPVALGDIHFSLRKGLGIAIEGFSVFGRAGEGDLFFTAEQLFVGLDLRSLLHGEARILRVYGYRPKIFLSRDENGRFNFEGLYAPDYTGKTVPEEMESHPLARSLGPVLGKNWVFLEDGEVEYRDPALPSPSILKIRNFSFHLRSALLRDELHFEVSGHLVEPDGGARFSLTGDLDGWKHARSAAELGVHLGLSFREVSASALSRFLPARIQGRRLSGTAHGSASYEGSLLLPGRIQTDLEVDGPLWDHPKVHTRPFAPQQLGLTLSAEVLRDQIRMDRAEIRLGGIRIQGRGTLVSKNGPFSHLELHLEGKGLSLVEAKSYLPLRLLHGKVWPFLIDMTQGGTVDARADLVGALSDFSRMETQEAENALRLSLLFQDATILLPVAEPYLPFRSVKGRLDLRDGDLFFRDFSAAYGKARLSRADGRIRGIHKSSSSLEIQGDGPFDFQEAVRELDHGIFPEELRAVVRQIHDSEGTGRFRLQVRHDFGQGADGSLHVEGKVTLDRVRARYGPWPLALDGVTGWIEFSDSSIRNFALALTAGNTPLEARGGIDFSGSNRGAPRADLHLSSRRLDLGDLMLFLGRDRNLQGALPASGKITFDGNTRTWEAQIGPGDATLSVGRYDLAFGALKAAFSGLGESLDIHEISFRAQDSLVKGRGRLDSLSPLAGRLEAAAAALDLDALLARKRPANPLRDLVPSVRKTSRPTGEHPRLDLAVDIGTFNYRPLRFESLRVSGSLAGGKLFVREATARNGKAGRVALSGEFSKQGERFPFGCTFALQGVEGEELLRWLHAGGGLLKGPITLQGQANGSYTSDGRWIQTLAGAVRLETQDGVIERYELLSKILTLVNVAQWSKVRLADFKTQGVPYRSIRGDLTIDNGILSSPGIEIDSTIALAILSGNYDLRRDHLAGLLSLRPMEQLDQVLDRVPVVGRIVQGPDGTIVIFYYRLEGPLKDPKVSLVPFRSLQQQPIWNLPAQTFQRWLKTVEEAFLGRRAHQSN